MLSSLVIPPGLQPGDKIAAVSLSWGGAGDPIYHPVYLAGKKALEETLGLTVVEMANTLKGPAFLYNNVQAKVDDLHQAFSDPSIKAVISCVGGDDSIRMIDRIDFDLIRNNPKIFLGYSDSTVQHFVCMKAGLRSYYGPAIMTSFPMTPQPHSYLIDSLKKTLFGKEDIGDLGPSHQGWAYEYLDWLQPEDQRSRRKVFPMLPWQFIQGDGSVTGRLLGGCTDVLPLINGTSVWPSSDTWEGAILFLENFGGPMSPDSFLAILRNFGAQGILHRINGILFGRPDGVPTENYGQYEAMLIKATKEYGRSDLPIVTRMDFGHTEPSFILPYGAMALIDLPGKRFAIEEPGAR